MKFTYEGYRLLLEKLKINGYQTVSYGDWEKSKRCVILRHDIDNDVQKALRMAALECSGGVKSTYFVLLTSDFYNVFSKNTRDTLGKILACGHALGLHFDEERYPEAAGNMVEICQRIVREAEFLSAAADCRITAVSMHRPSRAMLEADLEIPGMINSYGRTFFREFKYLSDSRRRWREPVEEVIESGIYNRLHILTHAFWYGEQDRDIHGTVVDFVKGGNAQRYESFRHNFTDLESVMPREELM